MGRLRPPFLDDVAHYRRLLTRHARVEEIELREEEAVGRRLPRDAFVCLLHADGRVRSSAEFARFLEDRRRSGRDLAFAVGGPFGLELEQADEQLSLGPMTLPHQLARVLLLEQLYRAHKILAGAPYDH